MDSFIKYIAKEWAILMEAPVIFVTAVIFASAVGRADNNLFRTVSDNPDMLPRYIKSKVRP